MIPPLPVPDDEAERGAALFQASVFERSELEHAGEKQDRGGGGPQVWLQPWAAGHNAFCQLMPEVQEAAEYCPGQNVSEDDETQQEVAILPLPCYRLKSR